MTNYRFFTHPRLWKIVGSGIVSYSTYSNVYTTSLSSSSSSSSSNLPSLPIPPSSHTSTSSSSSTGGPSTATPSIPSSTPPSSSSSNARPVPAWIKITTPVDPSFINHPSISSCFILLYHLPSLHTLPPDYTHYHAAPSHLQQGFGIRFATATRLALEKKYYNQQIEQKNRSSSTTTAENETLPYDELLRNPLERYSHYKLRPLLSPKVCLVLSWRGGFELPGGKRDMIKNTSSSSSSVPPSSSSLSPLSSTSESSIPEPTVATAIRELLEESGVALYDPPLPQYDRNTQAFPIAPNVFQIGKLTSNDAIAYLPVNDDSLENLHKPRWILYAKHIENKELFQQIVSAAPNYAHHYHHETLGTAAIQPVITYAGAKDRTDPTDRVYGLPRLLAASMHTYQSEMLLAGLEALNIFTKEDVQEVVYLANAFRQVGGLMSEGETLKGKGLQQL